MSTLREKTVAGRINRGLYNGRDINITDEERKRILTKCEKIDDVLNSLSLDRLIKFSSMASYHQVEARVTMEIAPQIKDIREDMENMEGMRPIEDESPARDEHYQEQCMLLMEQVNLRVHKFMNRLIEYHKAQKSNNIR